MASTASVDVIKSPQDKRLYRYVQLPSGMSVLLIHDSDIVLKKGAGDGAGDA
eukprot:gene21128-28015_t